MMRNKFLFVYLFIVFFVFLVYTGNLHVSVSTSKLKVNRVFR